MNATVRALLDWFPSARRDLPWREVCSPWRTLVSELMLQQTRVAVVTPRFESFLERFPDPATMARKPEAEVLAQWSGLGYYRRARNLHAAAKMIVARHGGEVPDERTALCALPGIGEYTAGAILSIAFGKPEPVVDGNVERVIARRFCIVENVKRGAARKRVRELARAAVEAGPPGEVNQALMELGALVCTPKSPKCGDCPLAADCRARADGTQETLPALPARKAPEAVTLAVALAGRDGRVLLVRHPEGGLLCGTWGPPFATVLPGEDGRGVVERSARNRGLRIAVGELIGTVRHQITHRKITANCFAAEIEGDLPSGEARLLPPGEFDTVGLSSLAAKALRHVLPT